MKEAPNKNGKSYPPALCSMAVRSVLPISGEVIRCDLPLATGWSAVRGLDATFLVAGGGGSTWWPIL